MHATVQKLPAHRRPVRSHARRKRESSAALRPVTHIVLPGIEVGRADPKSKETVTAFLRRTGWARYDRKFGWQFKSGLPTILLVNGEPVLRRFWKSTRISANDNLQFVTRPMGGGNNSKQIIGLVALVAVAAFAAWAGPALFGAGTLLAYGTTAVIGIAGSLLVNALTAPKAGATNDPNEKADQIYTASVSGNTAKLGQPLPVGYGREKVYPDFAAAPWSEYVGNDQYLNILLSVGMGSYEFEQMLVEDTPFWDPINGVSSSFSSATLAFYEPGESVTLFPTNVAASSEVTGQQLPDGSGTAGGFWVDPTATTPGAWIGPFAANPSGTLAQSLAVDFVLPSGCITVNPGTQDTADKAKTGYGRVPFTAEYCLINDAGAQIGDFQILTSEVAAFGSTTPIRGTRIAQVDPGRYAVRFRRDDAGYDSTAGTNAIVWAGLRAFLRGNNSFPDVSTIAIRIKATESTQGSFKFGVIRTRKLQVWNGASFVTQPTRNPAWAFYDAVTNAQYGSGHSISKTDFNAIVNHATGCDARGDHFDFTFTSAVPVPEALDKILTVSRSKHFWLGDTISIVRDEYRNVPSMLLTDREIVRDSTQITWTMLGEEDPDAVILEYVDESTWRAAQVQYPPDSDSFTATNPETKRIDGILNRDHAYRECAFYYLVSIYRREGVSIATEYEGRAITFGSCLRVQSELPMAYGYGGAVIDQAGTTLTIQPAPSWADAGPHFIRLRRPDGKWFGPVTATRGASDSVAILDNFNLASVQTAQGILLADVLVRESGGEFPSFELGTADNQSRLCVVLSGQPNGTNCTLNLVVDDERVHATDLGDPAVPPVFQYPQNASLPLIVGLNAIFSQGIAEPKLSASWFPTAGAIYYVADVSYDFGTTWVQVYEGQDNQFDKVVGPAALKLRVQAVNSVLRGPYSTLDLNAPSIVIASQTVALTSLIDGVKYQVTTALDQLQDAKDQVNQLIASLVSNDLARNWLDKKETRSELSSVSGTISARITEVQTVATDGIEAVAATVTTLTANVGDVSASVTQEAAARANADSAISGIINTVSTTVGQHTTSISTIQTSVNGIGAQFGVQVTVDGVTGGFVFQGIKKLDGSGATFSMLINGGLIVAGTIGATALNVGTLSAISANLGTITAGRMLSTSGYTDFDLNNERLIFSDST